MSYLIPDISDLTDYAAERANSSSPLITLQPQPWMTFHYGYLLYAFPESLRNLINWPEEP